MTKQVSAGRNAHSFMHKLQFYFFSFLKVPSSQNKVAPCIDSNAVLAVSALTQLTLLTRRILMKKGTQ